MALVPGIERECGRGVVHHRHAMPVALGVLAVGQLLRRDAGGAAEVVAKAERVPHLVHHQRLQRLADVFPRSGAAGRHHAARGEQRPGDGALAVEPLGEAAEQGRVTEPAEIDAKADSSEATAGVYSCDSPRQVWIQAAEIRMSALRISPGARIHVGGSDGVDRAVGGGPAHGRVARVRRAVDRVVGGVEHLDGAAVAGVLEGAVPLQDPGPHVGPPLERDRLVDVVGDGAHRLAHGARRLLLQPPPVHVADEEALRGVAGEILERRDEVPHPLIGVARPHRRRPAARAASSARPTGTERESETVSRPRLLGLWKVSRTSASRFAGKSRSSCRLERLSSSVMAAVIFRRAAAFWRVDPTSAQSESRKGVRSNRTWLSPGIANRRDRKGVRDRVAEGVIHRARHRRTRGGGEAWIDRPQLDPVALPMEADQIGAEGAAAIETEVADALGELGDEQVVAIELLGA